MKTKIKSHPFPISRILDISILTLFAITIFWLGSLGIKINRGVAKTLPVPEYYIRLQILDAGAGNRIMDSLRMHLDGYTDDNLEISIVDMDAFTTRKVERSFLINRTGEEAALHNFAAVLGLGSEAVSMKKLDANIMHISVTLVAGIDAGETILTTLQKRRETELP